MAEGKSKSFLPRLALWLLVMTAFLYIWGEVMKGGADTPRHQKISYSAFLSELERGNLESAVIRGQRVEGGLKGEIEAPPFDGGAPARIKNFHAYFPSADEGMILSEIRKRGVPLDIVPERGGGIGWQLIVAFLPWVLIIGGWVLISRRMQQGQPGGGGGLFTFGASKAKLYNVRKPSVTFKDVAGLEHAKEELNETVEFLKDPGKFSKIGAKVPKGILLVGPPGTGKTLLARAVAGEAGVPFFSISASEFIEMFVGVGASRVRDMFRRAREAKPSIIFIDEIDSVGRTRGAGLGGGHDEREQTLNQLLSEMDGFEPHEEIILLAATNRPDVLDPALLRPGRFDRHIIIDKPGWKDRREILKVHTRKVRLGGEVDFESIAKGTPGMTGADLENLANEAALEAVKKGKERVEMADFDEAKDRILMGTKRTETLSSEEKRITAYHESGHTLVSWELPYTDPVHKVSIIPRGMAMGVTQFLPVEDRHYYPKTYLLNKLAVALAGRGAERLVFNDVSTGAGDDLKNATYLAEKMVAQWGMSEAVGPVSLGRGEEHPFLGRELSAPKRYSEEMAWVMDREIRNMIAEAEAIADGLLAKNRLALDMLAKALLKEESLDKDEVDRIIKAAKGVRDVSN